MNGAMKAIAVLTVVVLSVSIFAVTSDGSDGYGDSTVAVIGDKEYTSLSDAVAAAQKGDTITLVASVTESITIGNGKEIVLNLNGNNITNTTDNHTITVKSGGKLTINGTGTVDNVSHAKGCIYNEYGGTVILNGGKYTRSLENGSNKEESGGNSWYNIANSGDMTINSGVVIEQSGHFSSMVHNGHDDTAATLTINGGTFSGGLNTLKNNDGTMIIHGGTFVNVTQNVLLNWKECVIDGGFFENTLADYGIICNASYKGAKATLSIEGGEFDGAVILQKFSNPKYINDVSLGDTTISGGVFYAEPNEEYYNLADGYTINEVGGKWYVTKQTDTSDGSVVTEESSIITTIDTTTASIVTKNASFKISGSSTIGNITVSAEPKTYAEAPKAVASYEITITASTSYSADITVDASIPNGYKALVYYIDDDGNLVPVDVVSYTSSTVTFRTTHTTPFVVMAAANPVIYDDDDYYPVVPVTPASTSSNDDDTKTIVACAAAAVAAALAVAFFLVDSRRP